MKNLWNEHYNFFILLRRVLGIWSFEFFTILCLMKIPSLQSDSPLPSIQIQITRLVDQQLYVRILCIILNNSSLSDVDRTKEKKWLIPLWWRLPWNDCGRHNFRYRRLSTSSQCTFACLFWVSKIFWLWARLETKISSPIAGPSA